ncbi:MAG: ABC transporter permease [Acidimicrobiia bacterium]|nr:ABC transporter permease [Acidimicrobiia bacterium]
MALSDLDIGTADRADELAEVPRAGMTPDSGRPGWAARAAAGIGRTISAALPPLLLIVALVGLWQWYVVANDVRPTTLPSPGRVVTEGWRFRSLIWENTVPTLKETFIGFSLSVMIGSIFAVVIDFSKPIRRALYPVLVASQTLPIIAIAPLMIIWFGFGLLPKIIVVVLVTFFPITIGLIDGFRSTEAEAMNLLGSMGASRFEVFRYVRLPSALPSFFSGLRIGITYAVVGAVFAEYVGAKKGLGIFMLLQKNSFRTDLVLAAVFVTALVSVSLFALVSVIQRLTIPWYAASRRHEQNA